MTEISEADRAPLELAMSMILESREPGRREQIESKLREDGWLVTAQFAAYSLQIENLHLKPREDPPCHGGKLFPKMQSLGISRWHPSPIEAIAAATKRS